MTAAIVSGAVSLILWTGALAQDSDPALDDLLAPPPGPSELDELSKGADTEFPDLVRKQERKPVSVTLRALNKVTAKYTDLIINMDETAGFGSLEITPRYCDKLPPEEFPETTAFLEIVDTRGAPASNFRDPGQIAESAEPAERTLAHVPDNPGTDQLFSGWMFASSPALSAMEHPVYDVWVIDCATVALDS